MKMLILLLSIIALNAEESFTIEAKIKLSDLNAAIKLVKQSDGLPIIHIGQKRIDSDTSLVGKGIKLKVNDEKSMIITTGNDRGVLNGNGKTHYLIFLNNEWKIEKSTSWVS